MGIFKITMYDKWWMVLALLLLASCSTTSNLPQGEVLYTGIKTIEYTDRFNPKKARKDSTGVIKSIAQSVKALEDLLANAPADSLSTQRKQSFQRLVEAVKADRQAFEETKEEVEAVLAYAPNNSLFGSSSHRIPFPMGLWVYNSMGNTKNKIGKWVVNTFGSKPVLISAVNPEVRAKVATNTLHNYGYFRGKVDYDILPSKNPRKAKVNYQVTTRNLFRLDSIAYLHFPPIADSLIRATASDRLVKKGDPFRVVNLSGEQTRIEQLFRDNGFYYYSAGLTTFRADTIMKPGRVQLQVLPVPNIPPQVTRRWYIGDTHIVMRHKAGEPITGSSGRRGYTYEYSGKKIPLRPRLWRQSILHRRGDIYRQSEQRATLEHLSNLGVFGQLDVNYVPRDSSATCDTLDINITAVMDKPYDGDFEMNVTSKSNDHVGPGVAFGLAKRNAFRGGEKVSFRIFGSYEWQTDRHGRGNSDLFNSYELGTSLSFEFPRFVFPGISRRMFRFPSSTTFSLDADWMNRAGFFNMVKMGLGATYKWNKTYSSRHELTLFNLDYDQLLSRTAKFDSIMDANPALYVSMRNQFIPSIAYTYTYMSPRGKRNPVWWQTSVKEAGNLTSCLYAAAGRQFDTQNKELFNNPFAQFVKVTSELHVNFKLPHKMRLATRLMGGFVYAYGNSTVAPYSEQFFVGGANSIRAFTVRTLGPGRFRSNQSKYAYMDQTGDLKFEANVELRFPLFGNLNGALFVDAGNVWLIREDENRPGGRFNLSHLANDIALGTGVGLRYDMEFLVLRLDLGMAIHDPYDTGKSGYYNIPKFTDGLGLHFAIGYPF